MAETPAGYMVQFDPGFPLQDVVALGVELMASGILAPGFIPPAAGLLTLEAIVYAKEQQGYDTVVLADRNLVSRMARVARDGHADLKDRASRSALALMAYCQAMNIDIEPSIAFHELGGAAGNLAAREELAWFRAADRAAALDWVALAAGRISRVTLGAPAPLTDLDFERPIARWRRNYVAALKAAMLELTPTLNPIDRMIALIDWMDADFILAGPAALYAAMYFGPKAARAGLFKQLKSPNREAAILGVRNAAWDMTHLSDFVRRVGEAEAQNRRYIFASADDGLTQIASRLFLGPEAADGWPSLEESLYDWWSKRDAGRLADAVFARFDPARLETREAPTLAPPTVDRLIFAGEDELRKWEPASSMA